MVPRRNRPAPAAGRYAQHVPQCAGQLAGEKVQFLQVFGVVVEYLTCMLKQLGRHPKLESLDVVRQAGHVTPMGTSAQIARLAIRPRPWEEPQFVLCRHPFTRPSEASMLGAGVPLDVEFLDASSPGRGWSDAAWHRQPHAS
jgi:hypothetical protein